MANSQTTTLIELAREISRALPDFQAVLGPGAGDKATHAFMRELRQQAIQAFGEDHSERKLCGETSLAADFYFQSEGTIVEVAMGLGNPATEFEKDILKAIMAQECGFDVRRLVFICRAGGEKKCRQPGRVAMRLWAETKHGLRIEVHDLHGVPRTRKRRSLNLGMSGTAEKHAVPDLPASAASPLRQSHGCA